MSLPAPEQRKTLLSTLGCWG